MAFTQEEEILLRQLTARYVSDLQWDVAAGPAATEPVLGGGPTYVVGNSVEGDTEDMCTHLDDGTGEAFREALTAAASDGGLVYLRRGSYQIGGAAGLTTIPENVTVVGEGYDTILALPTSGQMASLLLSGNSELQNLSVRHTAFPTANLTDGAGNRFVEMQANARAFNVLFECRANGGSVGFYPGFWSLIRMSQQHARLKFCRVVTYSSVALGSGSEAIGVMAVGTHNRIEDCTFGSSASLTSLDAACEVGEGSYNMVVNCDIFNSRTFGVRIVGVGGTVSNTAVERCRIFTQTGVGVGSLFVSPTVFSHLDVKNCQIVCSAAATAGVSFVGTDAGQDFDRLAISNCVLVGNGGGTGIIVDETSGAITNVLDSLNSVTNFSTARSGSITGPTVSVGNY